MNSRVLSATLLAAAAAPSAVAAAPARMRLTPEERTILHAAHRDRCPAISWESVWANEDWVFPFADGTALVLLGCNVGAYNPSTLVLLRGVSGTFAVVDLPSLDVKTETRTEGTVTHTTVLDASSSTPQHSVVYPRFTPETGVLQGTRLGRGLGDARRETAWVWNPDAASFSLLYWMEDDSTDGHLTPSCAFPVRADGPCPGHPVPTANGHEAMVYAENG